MVNKAYRRARMADRTATFVLYAVAGFFLLLLAAFAIYVISKGIASYTPKYIGFKTNGIGLALFNTIYVVFVSLLFSVPFGILAGIYMAEYALPGKLTSIIRTCIETLSSLPSIVVGLFGLLVFVDLTHSTVSIIAGGLTLSVLNIPLITRNTEDAIRDIPDTYREGSYALGTTKWQTIVRVLVPSCVNRIVTGIILAAGRCFGEAAALIYTTGMSGFINYNDWNPLHPRSLLSPFRPANTLSVHIWYL
ncbi:MAG: phosphate ABC transporter permease PstA, partial [Clostridia bacterium]|nr:phosphate ABC transporter permease PstA [Clostridia bacterium]